MGGEILAEKKKRKAVRNFLTGEISHYTNTKTVGLRDPFSGRIEKRVSKKDAEKRGISARTYTVWDKAEDNAKRRKKGVLWSI